MSKDCLVIEGVKYRKVEEPKKKLFGEVRQLVSDAQKKRERVFLQLISEGWTVGELMELGSLLRAPSCWNIRLQPDDQA